MLVITRKHEESFWIGEAKVTFLGYRGGQVRLGIEAPESMPVWRQEVLMKRLANGQGGSREPKKNGRPEGA